MLELQERVSAPIDGVPAYRDVARALEEVLAGPEFQRVERSVVEQWISAAWNAFRELFLGIPLRIPSGAGEAAAWLLAAAASFVLIIVLGHWAATLVAGRTRRMGTTPGDGDGIGDHPVTAADWLRLAAARASEGDLRLAATALYQSVLQVLDGKGVVRFHRSKTPGEYLAEVAGSGAEPAADAAIFLRSFQRLRFGEAAPTHSAYRRLEELARLDARERR